MSPSIDLLENTSCDHCLNPAAYPVRGGNYYECNHKMFSDDFPRWFALQSCNDVAQNSKSRQSPKQTNDDGSGEREKESRNNKSHCEQKLCKECCNGGYPNLFVCVDVL